MTLSKKFTQLSVQLMRLLSVNKVDVNRHSIALTFAGLWDARYRSIQAGMGRKVSYSAGGCGK